MHRHRLGKGGSGQCWDIHSDVRGDRRGSQYFPLSENSEAKSCDSAGDVKGGAPLARGHGRVPQQDADRALASTDLGSACPVLPRHHSYT